MSKPNGNIPPQEIFYAKAFNICFYGFRSQKQREDWILKDVSNRKAIGFADREQLMLHLERKTVLFFDDENY